MAPTATRKKKTCRNTPVKKAGRKRPESGSSSGKKTAEEKREEYLLLRRYANGDDGAFEEIYSRYADRLLSYVYRYVHDWQEAEDIVQEVFVQVLKDADSFEPRAALSTWMFRIATYMCLKRNRNRGIRGRILSREIANGTFERDNPETDAQTASTRRETVAAIKELAEDLPEEHRTIFILREYENLSYKQIAGNLGMQLGTVKSRLSRTRVMLREGLKAAGYA